MAGVLGGSLAGVVVAGGAGDGGPRLGASLVVGHAGRRRRRRREEKRKWRERKEKEKKRKRKRKERE